MVNDQWSHAARIARVRQLRLPARRCGTVSRLSWTIRCLPRRPAARAGRATLLGGTRDGDGSDGEPVEPARHPPARKRCARPGGCQHPGGVRVPVRWARHLPRPRGRRGGGAPGALIDAGLEVQEERPVVTIAVEDRPGSAAAVLRRVADADVNIDLLYVTADSRLVLGSDDTAALRAVLE